jgi:hypothetical protein
MSADTDRDARIRAHFARLLAARDVGFLDPRELMELEALAQNRAIREELGRSAPHKGRMGRVAALIFVVACTVAAWLLMAGAAQ